MARLSKKQRQIQKTQKIQAKKAAKVAIKQPTAIRLQKPQVNIPVQTTPIGMEDNVELKLREFLTDMLTERMDGVDEDLVNEVREAIYNATYNQLDRLSAAFPDQDVFKEFYENNNVNEYGANSSDEKEAFLEEILEYLTR